MIKEELYHKTVDILVQAYFNDMLVSGNQCGCAVGNMVAGNMGIKINKTTNTVYWHDEEKTWQEAAWYAYVTGAKCRDVEEDVKYSRKEAIKQIKSTGYSLGQIKKIEKAFERNQKGCGEDERMFNGLMAVIDVLDQIHKSTDPSISSTSKERFNKKVLETIGG